MSISTPEFDHFDTVVTRFRNLLKDVSNADSATKLSRLELEGVQLMRELQLTAPRLWNDFIVVSQGRRREMNQGLVKARQEQQEAIMAVLPTTRKAKKKKVKK